MLWKWITGIVLLSLIMLSAVLSRDLFNPNSTWEKIAQPYSFSIIHWELGNLFNKWEYKLRQIYNPTKLTEEDKVKLVENYISLAQEVNFLEWRHNTAEVEGTSPAEDIALWEEELQTSIIARDKLGDQVEEIIEGQISQIFAEEGLSITFNLGSTAELVFPPVDFEFENSPNVLIISPRDKIEFTDSVLLSPDLSLEEMMSIESEAEESAFSVLVERSGGVATYPSVISQTTDLPYILSTVAHEWLHQYFFFRPIGWNYWESYEMTTINETAASIAGDEIGALVYQRYYQRKVKEIPPPSSETELAFDFNKKMRDIRIAVDVYLENGEIEEAEGFMEENRKFLAENGYYIRKLNQAYFAFHGSYADSPTSVSPIGGELKTLREYSPSLGTFINTVAQISSYEQLQSMVQE